MKRTAVAALLALCACAVHAGIDDLDWLAGCWAYEGRDAGSGEQWMAPAGGTMFGLSRTVSGGRTVAFEYLRIVEEADGTLALVASPSGQATARFEMLSMSESEVVFSNPEHDFPQRIIYRLGDEGALLGRVEGTVDGQARAANFPMRRTQCAGE